MIKPSIAEILTPKPDARPRIYAYAIAAMQPYIEADKAKAVAAERERVIRQFEVIAKNSGSLAISRAATAIRGDAT